MAQTPQQASFSLRLHNKGGDRIKLSKSSKTCPVRGKAIPEFSLSRRISRRRRLADCETLQKRSLGAPSTYSSAMESASPARVTRRWRLTGQLANLAVLQYLRPRASLRATKSEIHMAFRNDCLHPVAFVQGKHLKPPRYYSAWAFAAHPNQDMHSSGPGKSLNRNALIRQFAIPVDFALVIGKNPQTVVAFSGQE